jgi:hypothetical protein
MDHFGCPALSELNGTKIHRLENVMTMAMEIHTWFHDLLICFDATVSGWFLRQRKANQICRIFPTNTNLLLFPTCCPTTNNFLNMLISL